MAEPIAITLLAISGGSLAGPWLVKGFRKRQQRLKEQGDRLAEEVLQWEIREREIKESGSRQSQPLDEKVAPDAQINDETDTGANVSVLTRVEAHLVVEEPKSERGPDAIEVGVADIILVSRTRNHRFLSPDEQEKHTGFAVTEAEAFEELLVLSGLDEVEIANEQLNMGRLQGPAGLIEALKPLVPDSTFDMEVTKISLPLPKTVRRRLDP